MGTWGSRDLWLPPALPRGHVLQEGAKSHHMCAGQGPPPRAWEPPAQLQLIVRKALTRVHVSAAPHAYLPGSQVSRHRLLPHLPLGVLGPLTLASGRLCPGAPDSTRVVTRSAGLHGAPHSISLARLPTAYPWPGPQTGAKVTSISIAHQHGH